MNNSNNAENTYFFNDYIKDIAKYSLLSRELERTLLPLALQGDEKARNQLICSNLRFVIKVALLYRGRGLPLLDLINEGNIGLIKAVSKYDIRKKVRLTTYAVWWIRQAISQAMFGKARLVRLSAANERMIRGHGGHTFLSTKRRKQNLGSSQLSQTHGYDDTFEEKLLEMNRKHVSLDNPDFGDSDYHSIVDFNSNKTDEHPDESTDRRSLGDVIIKSLEHLNPKEKKVIIYSFGLNSNAVMNLRELGELLGLSRERIRQIKYRALDKLKKGKMNREYLLAI